MIEPSQISAAITATKAAGELIQTLFDARVDSAAREKLTQMQMLLANSLSALVEAKQEVHAAQDAKREAESKVLELIDWRKQAERYKLFSPSEGALVQGISKSASQGQPAHYLCANCFADRKQSVLQGATLQTGFTVWRCFACRSESPTGYRNFPPAEYAPD